MKPCAPWSRRLLLAGLVMLVPLPANASGAWVLTEVTVSKPPISASPCYPGKTMDLSDGFAKFSQGYADCSGEGKVKGGERANTTIRWRFSQSVQRLQPDTPLVVHISITRESDAVPYYGGGTAYFYFRSQSAVGGLELKGFLGDRNFPRSAEREIRLDRVPAGRDGEKLTMWMNVGGESGLGDVFYAYEFTSAPPPPRTDQDLVACSQYARLAVGENAENLARGCGYSGPGWHSDYNGHLRWCMDGNRAEAEKQHDRRMVDLSQCEPKQPTGPTPTQAPPPPQKGYQLYFDGRLVSGPDAEFYTRDQAIENCRWNVQTKPNIRVGCVYNGEVLR